MPYQKAGRGKPVTENPAVARRGVSAFPIPEFTSMKPENKCTACGLYKYRERDARREVASALKRLTYGYVPMYTEKGAARVAAKATGWSRVDEKLAICTLCGGLKREPWTGEWFEDRVDRWVRDANNAQIIEKPAPRPRRSIRCARSYLRCRVARCPNFTVFSEPINRPARSLQFQNLGVP